MGDRAEIIGEGRRRIFRSAAAAMLALLAAPAAAQYGVPPPQNVPDAPSRSADSEAAPATQADLLRAASCLAGRDARAGEALLATAPYSQPERQEAVRALRAAERCLRRRGGLATSPLMLRGAMAEALYESRFPQPPEPRDPPAAPAPLLGAEAAAEHSEVAPAFALADCTAARQPALVRDLLAAEPASAAETAAQQALGPVFSQCVTAGTSLNIDRASLRAILAESLYRWSTAQGGPPPSP